MNKDMLKDIAAEAGKTTPPAAVVTANAISGWTMNDTVIALTIVYLLLQIGWLLWRWRHAAAGAGADRADKGQ